MTSLVLMIALMGSTGLGARSVAGETRIRCTTSYEAEIDAAVQDVSPVWTVPRALIKAVIQQESAFDPTALSPAGAVGLMQVLPRNAALLGVAPDQLWAPKVNILAGTRLLAILLRHYQGDIIAALVAYNARPREPYAPLPDNGETAPYVSAVLRLQRSFERCSRDPRSPQSSGL